MSPTSLAMLMVLVAAAETAACLFLTRREQIKRRVAEGTSAESCARMVELQELARIGTWEFDLLHDQIRWSAETFRIFGLPAGSQELDFADLLLAIDPEDRSEFDRAIQMAITEGQAYPGKATRLIGTILDITERKREENQLATAATHDPLTGLSNRRHGSAELEQSIRDARETATPLAVCLCDIDRFKQINDTHGHSAGDGVLQAVAQCLAAGIRRGDLAIRWGGDEFCLLFPGASAANAAVSVERIRQSLESLTFSASDGSEYGVTGTFGVAGLVSGMSSEALLEAADRALYCAKQQGRNRIGDVSVIAPFVASSKRSPQTQLRSPSAPVPKAEEPSATPP
jgi:diguanylate cyclase (GGDEF)-like protein